MRPHTEGLKERPKKKLIYIYADTEIEKYAKHLMEKTSYPSLSAVYRECILLGFPLFCSRNNVLPDIPEELNDIRYSDLLADSKAGQFKDVLKPDFKIKKKKRENK